MHPELWYIHNYIYKGHLSVASQPRNLECNSLTASCVLFEELSPWLEIGPSQTRSHIWTSETFLAYLNFLAGELRSRRRALGLSLKDAAMVICDCASQHSSLKFPSLKREWMRQHNCAPGPDLALFQLSVWYFIFTWRCKGIGFPGPLYYLRC